MQQYTEDRNPSQRSRPSVFSLYIIRYNRNGHGCRPRISGGGRIIQKDGGGCRARITGHGWPSSGGCILKDGGGCAPHRHVARIQGTPHGHGWRFQGCPWAASEGVSRGIFAGHPGGACRHAPRSVAAALACESGVFECLPCLIIS